MTRRALLAWSAAAAKTSPVFIVGPGRSGTSILYRTLQLQAPFSLGPGRRGGEGEVDLTESRLLDFPSALLRIARPRARGHLLRQFLLADADAIARVAAAVRAVPLWRRALLGLADRPPDRSRTAAGLRAWRASWAHHLARVYVDAARDARGVARLVEKSPSHARRIPELRSAFPDARILFCVRHPLGARSSELRRGQRRRELGLPPSSERGFESFVSSQREVLAAGLRERAARPDRLHVVRYEDFVDDPAKTLHRIGDFLGERFEPIRLPGEAPGDWHAPDDPLLSHRIAGHPRDWREHLSSEEARRIEAALAPEMAAFAYEAWGGAPD